MTSSQPHHRAVRQGETAPANCGASPRSRAGTSPHARTKHTVLLAVALGIVLSACAGCTTAALGPTYTQEELKATCERQRGWWHPNGLRGGFCEFRAAS